MSKSASVIEVNGNRYDAVTGQLLGAVKKVTAQVKNPASGVIDGLVRRPSLSATSSIRSSAKSLSAKTPSTNKALRGRLNDIAAPRQRTQRSQTLMRGAVKRPLSFNDKKSAFGLKVQKARVAAVSPARAIHAKTIAKDSRVKRFGKLQTTETILGPRKTPVQTVKTVTHSPQATTAGIVAKPLPSMITSASHQHLERLLDQALIQADAHKQALRSRAKGWRRILLAPKWLTIGGGSLTLLLVAGFFAWRTIPQFSMRVATFRSHVSAAVPAYTPSGYSFASPISSSDHKVTIDYKAAGSSSSGSFAITQQPSDWDSSTVAANAVPASSQVQTSQVNGTTVYIYGNDNDAKWVNHGVLFTLQDKANLSSDQILKIANGL